MKWLLDQFASKFQKKIHSGWKMWMLNFEQKVSVDAENLQVRHTYGIVLFTINRYFTCFKAVNLEQTLTVHGIKPGVFN